MTTTLAPVNDLPSLSQEGLDRAYNLEAMCRDIATTAPAEIPTDHVIHAGVYTRTCLLRKGCALVGALIKIPTTVIVSGDCFVNGADGDVHLKGYRVFRGGAMRKQVFLAVEDTYISMSFATDLTDLGECEKAFTDDYEQLLTRRN